MSEAWITNTANQYTDAQGAHYALIDTVVLNVRNSTNIGAITLKHPMSAQEANALITSLFSHLARLENLDGLTLLD